MIKNYFKTAFRSLLRYKNYTLINVAGLSVGIAVCLLMFLIIRFELSFDNYHKKKDRIYRVLTEYHHADAPDIFFGKGVPRAVPAAIKENLPQLEEVAVMYSQENSQIQVLDANGRPEKKFKEETGVFFTQPSLFNIFDYKWIEGNPSLLKDPDVAVLTKDIAEKYFGDWKSAIGKNIKWNNNNVVTVKGILDNIPDNTDLQFKVVISYGTGRTKAMMTSTNWDGTSSNFGCYVLLAPGIPASSVNTQLRALSKKMKSADNHDSQVIQALNEVHVGNRIGNFSGRTVSNELINALWLIAGFILLIACVNFINLSTARAINRAKEVSVRKVLGSNKAQLRWQFLTETFLLVIAAVFIAAGVAALLLPAVGKMLELPLNLSMFSDPSIWSFLAILTIVVTILAGFYPSVVMSRFNPIAVLKSRIAAKSTRGVSLRRGLVVFQFVIAQALIIGTLIIVKQMDYFNRHPLGFAKDAIVNIPFPRDSVSATKLDALKNDLAVIPGIKHISYSTNTPIESNNDNWTNFKFDKAARETEFYAIIKYGDDHYLSTYQLQLIAGRNLAKSDTINEFLVNETMLKSLKITDPQNILNKEIVLGESKGYVVGVIRDFNNRSLKDGYAPLLISSMKTYYEQAGLELSAQQSGEILKKVESIWSRVFPEFVFEYRFLDDKIASFYQEEQKLSNLYKVFAGIAILLSCLGLYGLVSFMAVQRTKEVGIRKILGATATNIIYLFSKEFVLLITIAFVIASPIAWYFMNQWLQQYVYRVGASWWLFVAGGLASVVIAMFIVSVQAIRSALISPSKSLRAE